MNQYTAEKIIIANTYSWAIINKEEQANTDYIVAIIPDYYQNPAAIANIIVAGLNKDNTKLDLTI